MAGVMRVNTEILCLLSINLLLLLLNVKLNNTPRTARLERKAHQSMQKKPVHHARMECMFSTLKLKARQALEQRSTTPTEKYSKRADSFQLPIHVDTSQDEKNCPHLYKIAREMLDGAKIKLPSETNLTRWTFRERIDLDILTKTLLRWKPPWNTSDLVEKIEKLQYYNVKASSIKARKYLLTYGHNCCETSKEIAVNEAIESAKVDIAEALDSSALSVPFQISHSNILRRRKGAGYWLWKPYIILKTLLSKMNDGDMLIYQDAGSHFIKDAGPLFKLCMETKLNILAFHMPYKESEYSKRDAFVLMGMDDPRVHHKRQTQRLANLIVLMKSCETIQFMMEYLAYTSDPRITTDEENVMGLPNFQNFVGNRHDQTVFSLLSKKWGVLEVRNPVKCHHSRCEKNYNYALGPLLQLYVHDRNRS